MIPHFILDQGYQCEFLGFKMAQNRLAVPTWSYALEILRPARVLEIGTARGGFTAAIAIACANFGAECHTFDIDQAPRHMARWFRFLKVHVHTSNTLIEPGISQVTELIKQPGRTVLLCDGGHKPTEWHQWAPHLKVGDIIGAHDYNADGVHWPWSEITMEDIRRSRVDHNLCLFMQEDFDRAGWVVCEKK